MASPRISFVVQNVPNAFRERTRLRRWLLRVAQDHGTRIDSMGYVLMTDDELLYYNSTFLAHEDLTDVITFPVDSNNGVAGDILISYDRVRENARSFGVSAQEELRRVMVHGLLHLLGHSDKNKAQRAAMRIQEDRSLKLF